MDFEIATTVESWIIQNWWNLISILWSSEGNALAETEFKSYFHAF